LNLFFLIIKQAYYRCLRFTTGIVAGFDTNLDFCAGQISFMMQRCMMSIYHIYVLGIFLLNFLVEVLSTH